MSMDMHIEYHSIGTPVSLPVGATESIRRYWIAEGKKLKLEQVVQVGENFYAVFSEKDYGTVLQLITELQVLQQHLISLEEDKMAIYHGKERIPLIVEALQKAVENWEGLGYISFG